MQKILALMVLTLLCSACTSTLKVTPINAKTGEYATSSRVNKDEILASEQFKPEYAELLYVKTDMKSGKYNEFFIKSLEQFKTFKQVNDKSAMETLLISRNLTEKVPSISDLVGLNRLSKEIGPFLIFEPTLEWEVSYSYSATFKLIDASTGKAVLVLKRKAFNWSGLDAPLFYPMLNAIGEWSQGKAISTATEQSKSSH